MSQSIQFICVKGYHNQSRWKLYEGQTIYLTVPFWESFERQYYWQPINPTELYMQIIVLKERVKNL